MAVMAQTPIIHGQIFGEDDLPVFLADLGCEVEFGCFRLFLLINAC